MGVGHGRDEAVCPVEALGSDLRIRVGQVVGHLVNVGEEGDKRVEGVGAVGHPLQRARLGAGVGSQLHGGKLSVAVDADGAIQSAGRVSAATAVRVERRALIVQREGILDVFHGDLALGHATPGDVVVLGAEVGVGAVPGVASRVEEALHGPSARGVVHVVSVACAAKGLAGVEDVGGISLLAQGEVKVEAGHPGAQVRARHALVLGSFGITEVKRVNSQLVGHGDVAVVRHAAGNPVMSAHRLHPPDLVNVREGDAVHLVGAIALEEGAKPTYAVARGGGVGEDEGDHILLADAAGNFWLVAGLTWRAYGLLQPDEWVGGEHALV